MTRSITRLFLPLVLGAIAIGLMLGRSPTPASAVEIRLISIIDGPQAVKTCAQGSPGTGFGEITYDTATNLLSWNVTFEGLSAAPLDAHFHGPSAGPGENAGIRVPMTADLTSPSEGSATITELEEADLLAGLWYINYHTAKCAGGEIRGQVVHPPVGGVAELADVAATPLEESPGTSTGIVAAFVAAAAIGVVALGGSLTWYARRRKA